MAQTERLTGVERWEKVLFAGVFREAFMEEGSLWEKRGSCSTRKDLDVRVSKGPGGRSGWSRALAREH